MKMKPCEKDNMMPECVAPQSVRKYAVTTHVDGYTYYAAQHTLWLLGFGHHMEMVDRLNTVMLLHPDAPQMTIRFIDEKTLNVLIDKAERRRDDENIKLP